MHALARLTVALAFALAVHPATLPGAEESPLPARETFIQGMVIYAARSEEDRRPGNRFPNVPKELAERLRKAFRDLDLHSFQTVESQTQPIYKAYDSWVFPDSKFKLELNSQGRTSDGGLKVVIQLWQDDLVLLKSDTILRGDSPLFIAGNPWGRGRLLFVLRLRNSTEGKNVRDRATER